MPLSIDNLRVGKKYFIRNFGEEAKFQIMEARPNTFIVKDLLSLELFPLTDFLKYGRGKDFELMEI